LGGVERGKGIHGGVKAGLEDGRGLKCGLGGFCAGFGGPELYDGFAHGEATPVAEIDFYAVEGG